MMECTGEFAFRIVCKTDPYLGMDYVIEKLRVSDYGVGWVFDSIVYRGSYKECVKYMKNIAPVID